MNIEIADFVFFHAVAQQGGITHAAKSLHCVPSNVSTRIRRLEQDLGVNLFIREAKTLRLSPQGRELLGYAKRILKLVAEARESMASSEPQGFFRLGSMDSLAATRLPAVLASYHKLHPKVTVELTLGSTKVLRDQVLAGELEAAVIGGSGNDARLKAQPLAEENLLVVAPADMAPVRRPSDIAGMSILAFPPGCAIRERMEAWIRNSRSPLPRVIELTSYHAILGCVAAGMGVACMPEVVLEGFASREGLAFHHMGARWSKLKTCLVWRDDCYSPRLEAFRHLLLMKAHSKPV